MGAENGWKVHLRAANETLLGHAVSTPANIRFSNPKAPSPRLHWRPYLNAKLADRSKTKR
eukprot:3192845-Pyramimonas_sp.AAC.1